MQYISINRRLQCNGLLKNILIVKTAKNAAVKMFVIWLWSHLVSSSLKIVFTNYWPYPDFISWVHLIFLWDGPFWQCKDIAKYFGAQPIFSLNFQRENEKDKLFIKCLQICILGDESAGKWNRDTDWHYQRESKTQKLTEIISQEGMVNWPKRKKSLKARIMLVQ